MYSFQATIFTPLMWSWEEVRMVGSQELWVWLPHTTVTVQ